MKINLFARKNIHLCDLKEQVEDKEVCTLHCAVQDSTIE